MALTMDVNFLKERMLEQLNSQMLEVAEPYVRQALDKIEVAMREKLASNLITQLDHSINFEVDQQQITIRIAR